jgi:hypothetical protein
MTRHPHIRRILSRLTAVAIAVAGTTLVPVGAAEADDDDLGTLMGMYIVLGGSYGGVTYDALWTGRTPNGSTTKLYIPPERTTLNVAAYFGNWPGTYNPDGTPAPGDIDVTYHWAGFGCTGEGPYERVLSRNETRQVPVDESGHITSPVLPSLAVSTSVPLDPQCARLGVHFYQPGRQTDFTRVVQANITRVPPADLPVFDAANDGQGRVILYTVGTTGEIEQVRQSGTLSARAGGVLRYFFTNCEHAMAFRKSMSDMGRDASGIFRIPEEDDIVSDLVGVTARKSGASTLKAWGLAEGTGLISDQVEVVFDENGPGEGCRLP